MPWKILGSGSYNTAYSNDDDTEVLKIQHPPEPGDEESATYDTPLRSVRLWNEINPHLPARLVDSEHGPGWVCPFIKGSQASDKDIAKTVVDIFNRTGRIITDAASPNNVLKTTDGKLVVIDIGMALQLDKREEVYFSENKKRNMSFTSLNAWKNLQGSYVDYFNNNYFKSHKPIAIETIKALLFIKANRPDVFNASFILSDPNLRKNLAAAYEAAPGSPKALKELDKLLKLRPVDLASIKESCKVELQRYIHSRGAIDKKGEFSPSFMTKWFRDVSLTKKKVDAVLDMINKIENAPNLEAIKTVLATTDAELVKSKHTSGLLSKLGKCYLDVEIGQDLMKKEEQFNMRSSL